MKRVYVIAERVRTRRHHPTTNNISAYDTILLQSISRSDTGSCATTRAQALTDCRHRNENRTYTTIQIASYPGYTMERYRHNNELMQMASWASHFLKRMLHMRQRHVDDVCVLIFADLSEPILV